MKIIKYEFDDGLDLMTPCPYKNLIKLADDDCQKCEHCFYLDDVAELVICNHPLTNKFLQDCLLALNWQSGDEKDILAVLESAREFVVAYINSNGTWLSLDSNQQPIIPAFNNLIKSLQEPTDAKA
jgi:hypothetical protein